ncbi:MAG: uncharacterized protein KVP18_004915 [Porospora cf. gigantea A]|uniref:uncharacterized protein n=1 Tax=Porospora cf. gigantea A TaxID=2853593 RepID=UPI00355A908D|nr:MAG: hypothetical protein KVP18_004915 [Porospora cf. gigantea A]
MYRLGKRSPLLTLEDQGLSELYSLAHSTETSEALSSLCLSSCGTTLATVAPGVCSLWKLSDMKPLVSWKLPKPTRERLSSAHFNPTNTLVLTSNASEAVSLHDSRVPDIVAHWGSGGRAVLRATLEVPPSFKSVMQPVDDTATDARFVSELTACVARVDGSVWHYDLRTFGALAATVVFSDGLLSLVGNNAGRLGAAATSGHLRLLACPELGILQTHSCDKPSRGVALSESAPFAAFTLEAGAVRICDLVRGGWRQFSSGKTAASADLEALISRYTQPARVIPAWSGSRLFVPSTRGLAVYDAVAEQWLATLTTEPMTLVHSAGSLVVAASASGLHSWRKVTS